MNSKFLPAGIIALFLHSLILLIPSSKQKPDNTEEYIKYQVSFTQRIDELYAGEKEIFLMDNISGPGLDKKILITEEISSNHIAQDINSNNIMEESGFISETGSKIADEPVILNESADYNRILAEINNKIRDNITYPRLARRRNIEGVVMLSFELQENGIVGKINVLVSSGYSVLDNAAYDLLERISPFEFDLNRVINLKVNIIYELEGN